jgi:hypothetical protein
VQLGADLQKELGHEIPLMAIFIYPTVRSFAQYLREQTGELMTPARTEEQTELRAGKMQAGVRRLHDRRNTIR